MDFFVHAFILRMIMEDIDYADTVEEVLNTLKQNLNLEFLDQMVKDQMIKK